MPKNKPKFKLGDKIFMRMYSEPFHSWIYNVRGIGWVKEKNIQRVKTERGKILDEEIIKT